MAIMAFLVLEKMAEKVKLRENTILVAFARRSMPMYLFHPQIICFVIVWMNGVVIPYVNAGVNFIVAVEGSFSISGILMRFKGTRFLTGR